MPVAATVHMLCFCAIFLPSIAILQAGRAESHSPPMQFKVLLPTSSPCVQFTVAFVPSDKSALLNATVAFLIVSSMFQQFT